MTHGTMAIIELVETFNINKKRPFGRFFFIYDSDFDFCNNHSYRKVKCD